MTESAYAAVSAIGPASRMPLSPIQNGRIIKALKEAKRAVYVNLYANRSLTNVLYRVRISLYGSFIINLAYAFVKLVSGIVYHSVWFGAIAVYYMVLCLMRALLVPYAGKYDFGKNCGISGNGKFLPITA